VTRSVVLRAASLALLLCSGTAAAGAQPSASGPSPRDRLFVTPQWLARHLHDSNLVLLQVGPAESYQKAHVPGARYINLRTVSDPASHQEGSLTLELPTVQALTDSLAARGVGNASQIVVYFSDEWVTPAARVVFTLDWAGLGDRTVVLDGGLDAWRQAGQPVSAAAPPPVERGALTLHPQADMVVSADWVQHHVSGPGYRVVDARARAFYDGVRDDRGKEGHIPGAASLPWSDLYEEHGALKPAAELQQAFATAGVKPGDTVVAYCHIGQYATADLLAARSLGYRVKLYDGAFQDWAQKNLPVEATPKP
jgi:thiosulfate/3-mercaptopyruvate sulfurtransferase